MFFVLLIVTLKKMIKIEVLDLVSRFFGTKNYNFNILKYICKKRSSEKLIFYYGVCGKVLKWRAFPI